MSYRIRRATPEEFDQWNDYVACAAQAGPFHQRESLELLAEYSGTELHPLLAYKGEQVIGLFPLFRNQRGPFTMVESPPLSTVTSLGPVLVNDDQLKQRKRERQNRCFIEGSLKWIDSNINPDFVQVKATDGFSDLRPFKEADYGVKPLYTYLVDISTEPDELLMQFSRDARSNIREMLRTPYYVERGDADDITTIVRQIVERHGENRAAPHITSEFVIRLSNALSSGQIETYVCYAPDHEFTGGIITIEHGDRVIGWMGGAKGNSDHPITEFLDWHIIQSTHERGYRCYDLDGANVRSISQYKAKFAPELTPYYQARKASPSARSAITARDKMKSIRTRTRELISEASLPST